MGKVTRKQIQDLQNWAIGAGIMRDPKSYSAEELKELCPNVPRDFIEDYVEVRDGRKVGSDFQRVPLYFKDLDI